ncbi:hypothetical protein KIN20_019223 [Parelaphostrongylus tenuis]|uniref:Uncharacterized protein n=1 Tax=Parelaphostrongylus tenuis TaxID=148309 RepID=A0AAD5MP86_PARTN|nr:hypothetical protein KIN20_019223 [Parelaphostrongylus tenuis]
MSKRSKSLSTANSSMDEMEKLFELLKGLSPREQATIRPVLERDLEFQRREKARIRHLKAIANTSGIKPTREA